MVSFPLRRKVVCFIQGTDRSDSHLDSKAVTGPGAIIRELKYAQDCGKKQILLVEDGVSLPDAFPNSKEYQQSLGATITEIDLIRLVKSIDRTYRNGRL